MSEALNLFNTLQVGDQIILGSDPLERVTLLPKHPSIKFKYRFSCIFPYKASVHSVYYDFNTDTVYVDTRRHCKQLTPEMILKKPISLVE